MELLTPDLHARLLVNGALRRQIDETKASADFFPVVKLFTPDANAIWLLSEIDPDDHDRAFGLCDLGLGFPELGYVSLAELTALRGPLGLAIERDPAFTPTKTISAYAAEARARGFINA